jgi:Ca2+-binding RTX toxin-like protein
MMADLFGNNLVNNLTEGVAADNILGAGGNDTLNGGDGNHSIYGDWANDSLNSGAGEDFMYGGEGNDALDALEADIETGIGDDVYIGEGNDALDVLEADIDKGIGDDVYIGEDNDAFNALKADIDTGIGDDFILLSNPIVGYPFNDELFGTIAADTIYGLGGNDTIHGLEGNDRIHGDSGNDLLYSGEGQDSMYGGSGNDTLSALASGGFDHRLLGGIGNDVYQVWGGDTLVENPNEGIDIVQASSSYILGANVENLLLTDYATDGTGNNLNNQITGNSLNNNRLSGLGGNDNLNGGWGSGNDTLNGGSGNDTLTGGFGSDQFLFNTALATANVDRITDFSIFYNDKIVLDKSVFSALETLPNNVLLATDFAVIDVAPGAEVVAAGNNADEIVYNNRTGNLFYNPNNKASGFGQGGGRFATIVGSPDNLSNTYFRVVA